VIIDARSLEQNKTIETDVCIVGTGTAGITLAREFIDQKFRVCLLESGGLKPDKETQALQWGENIGHPYYSLDVARPRYLGGTTNRWHIPVGQDCSTARMRPLDEMDFEERDWVPYSGWPFSKSHLDPFYDRAQTVCKIEPCTYDLENWEDNERRPRLPIIGDGAKTVIFKFGSRYPFIRDYMEQIKPRLNRTVTRLQVATMNGKRLWVSAKFFVLAAGAIENARLLLVSDKIQNTGLGNDYDLVGRFFMEHPHYSAGPFVPANPNIFKSTSLYNDIHVVKGTPIIGKVSLSEKIIRKERLLNQVLQLYPRVVPKTFLYRYPIVDSESVSALIHIMRRGVYNFGKQVRIIMKGLDDVCVAAYRNFKGQALGMVNRERIKIFQLYSMTILDDIFRRSGLGRVYGHLYSRIPSDSIHGGWHHMGTTRMHLDPKKGVVDEKCKVHSIPNLFIAGPSVFPTGGYANPSLTIVALAIRLADYIKRLMG
jgi:choline dehydrogenase-like flavoprotein